jgi:hypothetical protein
MLGGMTVQMILRDSQRPPSSQLATVPQYQRVLVPPHWARAWPSATTWPRTISMATSRLWNKVSNLPQDRQTMAIQQT